MFRASDIFGRKPGQASNKALAAAKAQATQKRPAESASSVPSGASSRTWDPATGQFVEEELPAEVQEMMGIRKRPKVEQKEETRQHGDAWGSDRRPSVLGQKSVSSSSQAPVSQDSPAGKVDTNAPSVEYRGFSKVDLNDRYYERPQVAIHGRPTYWTADSQFFLYWQGDVNRWSICDAASYRAVRAGHLPGWAYKGDHRHLCNANGWQEAWEGVWREPDLEVTFRSSSHHKPLWDDPTVQASITTVDFTGFSMKELNTRFHLRPGEDIAGKHTYWEPNGVYFIYWQQQMRRWAICDLKCLDAVKEGQCPGWAFRADEGHFANSCGWKESRSGQWVDAIVDSGVVSTCTKGLKVEFTGFTKQELNQQFVEKPEEEIQGRVSFWDSSNAYFIYWQKSMKRWAMCDSASLHPAKNGLSPGWAYTTDSQHFARSSGWMEAWGATWKPAAVTCTVLEGTVKDDISVVKAEPGSSSGTQLSVDQYKVLVTKVYEQKNPAKLADLGHLFKKYQGKEQELFAQVCTKYEADAEALAAGLSKNAEEEAAAAPAEDEFSYLESAPGPDLSPQEYAILIQNCYERHKPEKLADLAKLLTKYRSREKELYLLVCDRYGLHPAKFHAQMAQEAKTE